MKEFIVYARTSTRSQNLGIEAQSASAERYVRSVGGEIIAVYSEQESGKRDDRPELWNAIRHCGRVGATLVVAKLDRLTRDMEFGAHIRKELEAARIDIVVAEAPDLVHDTMTFGMYLTLAQKERELISQRTRAALAAKKSHGAILGNRKGCDMSKAQRKACKVVSENADAWAASEAPMIRLARRGGSTLTEIADSLNAQGKTTRRGGKWTATAVKRILERTV